MLHAEFKIPVKGIYKAFISCQCLKRDRIDKISRILCHQYMDMAALFHQHAGQSGRLVCRDTSRNSQNNMFSFQHKRLLPHFFLFLLTLLFCLKCGKLVKNLTKCS